MKSSRKKNAERVVTEFEEPGASSGNKFVARISSKKFSNMTKKTVFAIALVTAIAVNLLLDYVF